MTKPDKILSIFQLILVHWVFGPPNTPHPGLGKKNLVFFCTPQVDPFVKFYCIFNALVRQNLQRWTGFDLLIILGVKFWWISFFLEPLSPFWKLSYARLKIAKKLATFENSISSQSSNGANSASRRAKEVPKTSQELRMLSSVTINCQVRMIV